jgi:arginyl-tRNA synthetase
VEFSFEESISLSGASGPYLQYAYVRTKSVINKSKGTIRKSDNLSMEKEELEVLRRLVHFEEIVYEARKRLAPNLVASYLFELAKQFNLFYQKHKISDNEFRLSLTEAIGQTIQNGLLILGIPTVEKM